MLPTTHYMLMKFLEQKLDKLTSKQQTLLALVVFAVIVAAFYGNTLGNGFVYDDNPQIVENPYVQSFSYLHKVVSGCAWESVLGTCDGAYHYRPIQNLSFLLTYQVSSAPWLFHLVNIIYFYLLVALVFLLFRLITRNTLLAFFTALIFSVHPLAVEAVNWIVALVELLYGVLAISSIYFYVQYRNKKNNRYFIIALLFYFFAILSKEAAALTIPPLFVAVDFFLFEKRKELFSFAVIKKYALVAIPFFVYFVMRQLVVGGFATVAISSTYFGGASLHDRVYYFFWLFTFYVRGFFYPDSGTFWRQTDIPQGSSFFSFEFFILVLIFAAFLASIFFFTRAKMRLAAFGLVWFAITIAPVLVFYFAAMGSFFAKRFLLVPSIGPAFLIALALAFFWQYKGTAGKRGRGAKRRMQLQNIIFARGLLRPQRIRQILVVLLLLILVIFSWSVVYRHNQLWEDSITLSRAELSVNENAPQPRQYLAGLLRWQGDFEGAREQYFEILERNPDYHRIEEVYHGIAASYQQEGNASEAERYYLQAADSSGGSNYKIFNDLGALYFEQGQHLQATINFCRAIQVDPAAQEPQFNLNGVGAALQAVKEDDPEQLYTQLTDGSTFQKSDADIIRYGQRDCTDGKCQFFFASRLSIDEIVLPFLIHGITPRQNFVEVEGSSYDPDIGGIILQVDGSYENINPTFFFPTCDVIYYEAATQ